MNKKHLIDEAVLRAYIYSYTIYLPDISVWKTNILWGLKEIEPSVETFCFSNRNIKQIYCTCFNFTAVLFPFLSSPWVFYRVFLHSIFLKMADDQSGSVCFEVLCQSMPIDGRFLCGYRLIIDWPIPSDVDWPIGFPIGDFHRFHTPGSTLSLNKTS